MRLFIHKPTGKIASYKETANGISYYNIVGSRDTIPEYLLVSDWYELTIGQRLEKSSKPEPEVPPGIVAFKDKFGNFYRKDVPGYVATYEDWYRVQTVVLKNIIHTISVNGVEWSVGEKVKIHGGEDIIDAIEWCNAGSKDAFWMARLRTWSHCPIANLKKLETRKPVVTLQGKDMFEGDKIWYVNKLDWCFDFEEVVSYTTLSNTDRYEYFNSIKLAEQYIIENKPVYPEYWVACLIDSVKKMKLYGSDMYNPFPLIDKLETFKNEKTVPASSTYAVRDGEL